ncbi:glycine--tRNA ligase subunit beta [Candidatus Steffania adelgidicola]|uniref:glycine--tRNA ligase subunit beta n=1 Tax=Candidatus Steffania adelgidicola TaxID=1076626 RepID=UPI001D022347|nr:glycine--tRNA ligase subunit beta [Candidatus Steffania adelgidicola]UDG79841.1 Glycine--tRNA ligase beta subunit [Candidatus Steffania adelgidicola]
MAQHTFLVEIGTEELPPKNLRALGESFAAQIGEELDTAHIFYGRVNWFATPRRLAVKVTSIHGNQADKNIERKGPSIAIAFDAAGNPTKAAEKWAQCCGITVREAEHLTTEKGAWLLYRNRVKGKPVQDLLCNIVNTAIGKLQIPKMMRWGDNNVEFIRPVHTVTLLLDNTVIPGKVLDIEVDRVLYGHRFMGERKINLEHADQYAQVLLSRGRVMVDYLQRKETIRRDATAAAKELGGEADINDNLLEEVTSLVEWPVVLTACFEKKFLSLPAIVYTIKGAQKYFPVYGIAGNLLPYFIFVANIESKDPFQIIAGNEKVVRPRLADAEFFFNTDRKQRLEDRLPFLDAVLFQKQLGTLRDKSTRIEALASWIADQIGANVSQAARAGLLSKCDLITNMVFEFTDSQGEMGMHYARHDGELEVVALAQKEQYYPRFANDILPTTSISCTVAIADKIDTVTGIFGIGDFPRGDKDPFALRRKALGVLRIIVEKQLPLDLQSLIEESARLYGKMLTNPAVVDNVINFMLNRFRAWYQEKGHRDDTIQAVLACRPTCPVDFDARIRAVSHFRTLKQGTVMAEVYKRVSNILAKSHDPIYQNIQSTILQDPAEIRLAIHLSILSEKLQPLFKEARYQDALIELVTLHDPVNTFFNNVMVMTDDRQIRMNRLTLLNQLRMLFLRIADMTLLQ